MLYIIYQGDRDDGAEIRAANKDEHFVYLDRHQDILLLGGALLGDDGVKRTGSCLIINVPSPEQAEEFSRNEPFRKAGLFKSVKIARMLDAVDYRRPVRALRNVHDALQAQEIGAAMLSKRFEK